MKINKYQIGPLLIQVATTGHWQQMAFFFDCLCGKLRAKQAQILRDEAGSRYMPAGVYGSRKVFLA